MTAILSTVGALFSYQGGATQNDAVLHKNEASIKKTEAANQWSYYQAKSNKQNLAELAVALAEGDKKQRFEDEMERYKKEKAEIKLAAEELETASKEAEHKSELALHEHHRWAQAMTAIQIAISMAAITLLTRRRWLHVACYIAAGVGAVVGALALLHV